MGSVPTATVQTTLLPPALARAVLEMRYDASGRRVHLALTVSDATSGETLAIVSHPFAPCNGLPDARSQAMAMLEKYTELVLNPEPF